jgi:hypothetical protein
MMPFQEVESSYCVSVALAGMVGYVWMRQAKEMAFQNRELAHTS